MQPPPFGGAISRPGPLQGDPIQPTEEVLGGGGPSGGVLGEAGEDESVERVGYRQLGVRAGWLGRGVDVRHDGRDGGVSFERPTTREQPVRHAAQGVEVGASIDGFISDRHLRRHEVGCPGNRPRLGHRHSRSRFGGRRALNQPEVQHLHEIVVEGAPA